MYWGNTPFFKLDIPTAMPQNIDFPLIGSNNLVNSLFQLHHLITLPDSDLLEARETRDFVLGELNTLAKGKGLTPIELARAVHLTTEVR